jgi:hypothetical protein
VSPATTDRELPLERMQNRVTVLAQSVEYLSNRVSSLEIQLDEAVSEANYFKVQVRELLPRTVSLKRIIQQSGLMSGSSGLANGLVEFAAVLPVIDELKREVLGDQGRVAHLKIYLQAGATGLV